MKKVNREEREDLEKALGLNITELEKKASNLIQKQKEDLIAFVEIGGEVSKTQSKTYMIEALERDFNKRELATLLTDAWFKAAHLLQSLRSV